MRRLPGPRWRLSALPVLLQARDAQLTLRSAAMACVAACAAESVVSTGTPCAMATWRRTCSSPKERPPSGVLITRSISPLMIRSTPLGRPSLTLSTVCHLQPLLAQVRGRAARCRPGESPARPASRAMGSRLALSRSLTLRKTVPSRGSALPAAICALA